MPPSQRPPEFSDNPELPKFTDRLPDLTILLRHTGRDLEQAQPNQTYLPFWEEVYVSAHSLKGILHILDCPAPLAEFILGFNQALLNGLAGPMVCRKMREAGAAFQQLAQLLDEPDPLANNGAAVLQQWLVQLQALYEIDIPHEKRARDVPAHLFYVNEFVSKKAREILLLSMNHTVVEDEIRLDDIPLWRTQLNEALVSPEFGRGIVVNFLPYISSEGSRTLKVWAWVAAATYSRAALKQRIKEVMPKATLTKL